MTRKVYRISGTDRETFLQNLVTNDVAGLSSGMVWTALLTPQGKYLADFFLIPDGDDILLDVAEPLAAGLAQRLTMYKLRADVTITPSEITVSQGLGAASADAFQDPRDPSLGWRSYKKSSGGQIPDWEVRRIKVGVPESGVELVPNESFPLEVGFERFHGVDFKKGCYVGQEVTARMKHKTELRKGLCRVRVSGAAPVGTEIVNQNGKVAGTLYSQADGMGLAHLRFDRVDDAMLAGDARVQMDEKL